MTILELKNIHKSFGNVEVIKDLSLSVEEHGVYGFLGKNGAGKTTAMKMILGFLQADRGEIRVCGEQVSCGNTRTNRYVGYLPDVPEFYGYMRPKEYLMLCGEISGLPKEVCRERIRDILALVGLEGMNRRIRGFSRGMKQRLGIAQALINEPRLLICDEPTSALDPVGRKEILDLLAIAGERTTVVFSTHILSDAERICDSVGILDQGRLVLQGNVSEMKESHRKNILQIGLKNGYPTEQLAAKIEQLEGVRKVSTRDSILDVHLAGTSEGKPILEILLRENAPLLRYEFLEPSLEHVFLEVVQ